MFVIKFKNEINIIKNNNITKLKRYIKYYFRENFFFYIIFVLGKKSEGMQTTFCDFVTVIGHINLCSPKLFDQPGQRGLE